MSALCVVRHISITDNAAWDGDIIDTVPLLRYLRWDENGGNPERRQQCVCQARPRARRVMVALVPRHSISALPLQNFHRALFLSIGSY